MQHLIFSFYLFVLLAESVRGEDRNPGYVISYPDSALIQNGGCVYNISNSPESFLVSAKENGIANDRSAFVAALDYILKLMDNGRPYTDDAVFKHPNGQYIVYIPDGISLVSDMIT